MKGILGIILIILAIGTIYMWEKFGRETFLYEEIIVASQDINQYAIINESMLKIEKIEKSKTINNPIKDITEILGLEAKQHIPQNAQIDKSYLDDKEFIADEKKGEFIFRIPNEWVVSVPETLRRKDKVYFYPIKEVDTTTLVQETATGTKPICKASVIYVKDSTNREVENASGSDRFYGTSNISSVEIISDSNMIKTLEKYYNNGYKFIILYN